LAGKHLSLCSIFAAKKQIGLGQNCFGGIHCLPEMMISSLARSGKLSGLEALGKHGVEPDALQVEMERGRSAGVSCLLAGMELVELEGITNLNPRQIRADLHAFHHGGADGLIFSWDLQLMPDERLALVAAELADNWSGSQTHNS
jgi:hypothetical protein